VCLTQKGKEGRERRKDSCDGDEHCASFVGSGFGVVHACVKCFGVEAKINERKGSEAGD